MIIGKSGSSSTETRITSLNDGALEITTHRFNATFTSKGQKQYSSMTLDAVATCSIETTSYPFLLYIGIIIIAFAVMLSIVIGEDNVILFGLQGIIAIGLHYLLRKTVLQIESTGGKCINVAFGSNSHETIKEFIDTLNKTKIAYMQDK